MAGQRLFNHQGLLGGGTDHHRQPVWLHLPPLLLTGRLQEVPSRQAGGKAAPGSGLACGKSLTLGRELPIDLLTLANLQGHLACGQADLLWRSQLMQFRCPCPSSGLVLRWP